MVVLVTGVAGFIGSALSHALLEAGHEVVGVDHLRQFPALAQARLKKLQPSPNFRFYRLDLAAPEAAQTLLDQLPKIQHVVHLAGRGGVRLSREKPELYVRDNIQAQTALLQACRTLPHLRQIVYASSSAVYGHGAAFPFSEANPLGVPSSFYAVTKRTNELTAEVFAGLYGLSLTAVRFFTVYGPWGRPDMACWKFASALRRGEAVTLWQEEGLARDFTYIADVVAGLRHLLAHPAPAGQARQVNLGKGQADSVGSLIRSLVVGLEPIMMSPPQISHASRPSEDLLRTQADTTCLREICDWQPRISLAEGVASFTQWFRTVSDAQLRVWERQT